MKNDLEETFGNVKFTDDKMAMLIKHLEEINEHNMQMIRLFPKVIDILREERILLLREAEKRFSDLWQRIDVYKEGDEDCWITAMRIIDHYKETYKPQKLSNDQHKE